MSARRSRRNVRVLPVVALLMVALLAGGATPAVAANRSRFFQFNMAGNTDHHGRTKKIVPAVVRSLKDHRPVAASLNEVCRNQFRTIKRRVARGDQRWALRGTWVQTKGSANDCPGDHYGIGVLTRNRITGRKVVKLPNTGQTERRKLLCATTTIRGRRSRVCTTHIARDGAGPRARQIRKVAATANPWVRNGTPVVLMGDFNATPYYGPLDRIYSMAYPWGRGRFKEADSRDACRGCGEATHGNGKIDYIFLSGRHFSKVRGNATHSDFSDHDPLRGSARLG